MTNTSLGRAWPRGPGGGAWRASAGGPCHNGRMASDLTRPAGADAWRVCVAPMMDRAII
jgi:hypothetical protein